MSDSPFMMLLLPSYATRAQAAVAANSERIQNSGSVHRDTVRLAATKDQQHRSPSGAAV